MERFEGHIIGIELPDIIQLHSLSRATICLTVEDGHRAGKIFFEDGEVVHAEINGETGRAAFFEIMSFKGGRISGKAIEKTPTRTIWEQVTGLLLEAARKTDEALVDEERAQNGVDENMVEDGVQSTMAEKGGPKASDRGIGASTGNIEEAHMTDLKEILGSFTEIPGVNTACLVGRDGFLVESVTMAGVDAEMIGAIASSGFGAAEAMGGQLGKGGLNLCMIEFEQGPVMLAPVGKDTFLVIVADQNSNLGLIRLKIRRSAKDLEEATRI